MTFISELKRRNVFKVASVYLVTSWLIIQIVAVISPSLHIPTIFSTIVTVVLIIGFPLACIFAWAFELTPQGLKPTREVDFEESIAHQTGSRMNKYLVAALVFAVGFIAVDKLFFRVTQSDAVEQSIAVLPFEDMSPDRSQEYFGDGIAEEILNALAQLDKMTVISRTSSFRYKTGEHDIRKIGQELNVGYILEGSVRKDNDNLRITAQLIDAKSGAHVWSETFDRKLTNIFALQDELTYAITQALQLNLLPDEIPTAVGMTNDSRAYELFVEARELSYQRTSDAVRRAVPLFQQALSIDPKFHLAKAELYMTYAIAAEYGGIDFDTIEQEHERLFWELLTAPDFALKWLVMSLQAGNNNASAMKPLLEKAYRQAPNNPYIQNFYLLYVDDIEATLALREQIRRTNPADQINLVNLGELYIITGQAAETKVLHDEIVARLGTSVYTVWLDTMYTYGYMHDAAATAQIFTQYSGELSSTLRSVDVATQLALNNIDDALQKLNTNLAQYPDDIYSNYYTYSALLHLQERGQLNESQQVALSQLPIDTAEKQQLDAFYSMLSGDPTLFEAQHQLTKLPDHEFIETLQEQPLTLLYLAIKKRHGSDQAVIQAVIETMRSEVEESCLHNLVSATSYWCEAYFYTANTPPSQRLIPQTDVINYWSVYRAGHEFFMLTDPSIYTARDDQESLKQMEQMLANTIEVTHPEILTRPGLIH